MRILIRCFLKGVMDIVSNVKKKPCHHFLKNDSLIWSAAVNSLFLISSGLLSGIKYNSRISFS